MKKIFFAIIVILLLVGCNKESVKIPEGNFCAVDSDCICGGGTNTKTGQSFCFIGNKTVFNPFYNPELDCSTYCPDERIYDLYCVMGSCTHFPKRNT